MGQIQTIAYRFLCLLTLVLTPALSMGSAHAVPFFTYEEFVHMPQAKQRQVVETLMISAIEMEQVIIDQYEKEKSQEQKTVLIKRLNQLRQIFAPILSQIMPQAIAAPSNSCIFGGWITSMSSVRPQFCQKPQSDPKLKKEYEQHQKNCAAKDGNRKSYDKYFVCNPAIFGMDLGKGDEPVRDDKKPFCVLYGGWEAGAGAPYKIKQDNSSQNASLDCYKQVQESKHREQVLDDIVEKLSENQNLCNDVFQTYAKTIFEVCACNKTGIVSETYRKHMYGKRTCYSLLAQMENILEKGRTKIQCDEGVINSSNAEQAFTNLKDIKSYVDQNMLTYKQKQGYMKGGVAGLDSVKNIDDVLNSAGQQSFWCAAVTGESPKCDLKLETVKDAQNKITDIKATAKISGGNNLTIESVNWTSPKALVTTADAPYEYKLTDEDRALTVLEVVGKAKLMGGLELECRQKVNEPLNGVGCKVIAAEEPAYNDDRTKVTIKAKVEMTPANQTGPFEIKWNISGPSPEIPEAVGSDFTHTWADIPVADPVAGFSGSVRAKVGALECDAYTVEGSTPNPPDEPDATVAACTVTFATTPVEGGKIKITGKVAPKDLKPADIKKTTWTPEGGSATDTKEKPDYEATIALDNSGAYSKKYVVEISDGSTPAKTEKCEGKVEHTSASTAGGAQGGGPNQNQAPGMGMPNYQYTTKGVR